MPLTDEELDDFLVDHLGRFVTAIESIATSLEKFTNPDLLIPEMKVGQLPDQQAGSKRTRAPRA